MSPPWNGICELACDPVGRSGAWNMAADELLLERAVREHRCSLRWYRWSQPTLSLGYFQARLPVDIPPAWQPLSTVRRLSGGGAILHHHEWTYACALPAEHPLLHPDPRSLYRVVHQALIEHFARWQIPLHFRETPDNHRDSAFLCFLRGDPLDVLLGNHKVLGSAQRRRRGAVLQHGSLLLAASPFAPEIPGIEDLQPGFSPPDTLGEILLTECAHRLAPRSAPLVWTPDELARLTAAPNTTS